MRMSAALLATMTVLLVSSAASANDVRRVELVDSNDGVVGTIFGDRVLLETAYGQVPLLVVGSSLSGTVPSSPATLFAFTEPDCGGVAHVLATQPLWKPSWHGSSGVLYTTAPTVTVDVASVASAATPESVEPGDCTNGGPSSIPLDPVVAVGDLAAIHPPPYRLRFVEETAFHPLTPCRLFDTRQPQSITGGAPFDNSAAHPFTVQGRCGVPVGARGVAINLTVVGASTGGDLRLFPAGPIPAEQTSAINYVAGQTLANAQLLMLAEQQAPDEPDAQLVIGMIGAGTVHVLVDVTGYLQ